MNRLSALLATSLAFFVALDPTTAGADAYGPPFSINGSLNITDSALQTRFAKGANGDAIALWQSGGPAAPTLYIQRYDAGGRTLGGMNVASDVRQVAMAGNGNYALLSDRPDGSGLGVFITVYSRNGAVVVPSFRVNDETAGDQRSAVIAMNAAGMMVVGWTGPAQASCPSLHVKRFNANGTAVAPETVLFQTAAEWERWQGLDVAIDPAGNYAAAWAHGHILTSTWSEVYAQRFAANGSVIQGPFQVNTTIAGGQIGPRVVLSPAGGMLVIWDGPRAGSLDGLFGQRYLASGSAAGGEFRIDQANQDVIEGHDVAMDLAGNFVVTWHDESVAMPRPRIVARAFTAAGIALGDRFVVSANVDDWASLPQIGMDAGGNFDITWLEHHYTSTLPINMLGRRFSPLGTTFTPVANGQLVSGLSGATGSWRYFKLTVPTGHNTVESFISGGSGDADLYLRLGALPTLTAWDGRPYLNGNNEGARMTNFPAGDWYIGIRGYSGYSGLSLQNSSR
jgi:serine protease